MKSYENFKYRILKSGPSIEKNALKEDLELLWIDTFGDSKEYVNLVYDTYLDSAIIGVCQDLSGVVVSSLMAIPYTFLTKSKEENKNQIMVTGWYLCGLSTIPSLRGRGIMDILMKMTETEISENESGFLFLIPADSRLERYYGRKGYRNAGFRTMIDINRNASSDTKWNDLCFNLKRDCTINKWVEDTEPRLDLINFYWDKSDCTFREELLKFISESEHISNTMAVQNDMLQIEHSIEDWKTILKENCISEGHSIVLKDKGKIVSFAIGYVTENTLQDSQMKPSSNVYEIRKVFGEPDDRVELLKQILEKFDRITLYSNIENPEDRITVSCLSDKNLIKNEKAERYIMVKSVYGRKLKEKEERTSKNENSTFATDEQVDFKYSIFNQCQLSDKKYHFAKTEKIYADLLLD